MQRRHDGVQGVLQLEFEILSSEYGIRLCRGDASVVCSVDEQPTNDIFSEPHTSPQAAELLPSSNVEMVRATLLLFIVTANTLTPAPASVALASIRFKIRPSMDRVGIWYLRRNQFCGMTSGGHGVGDCSSARK